ncbi:metallophosphoesterase [Thermodesulfobacteriota bacterium]
MKILYTSDIHASRHHLPSMFSVAEEAGVDSIVMGGDLIPHYLPGSRGSGILRAQAEYLRDTFIPAVADFKQRRDVPIYLDLANDDFICNRKILETVDGKLLNLLHMRKHRFTDSIDIMGYMNVPPTPFGRKDWEKPDTALQPYAPGTIVDLKGYVSTGDGLEETKIDLTSDDTIENELLDLSKMIEKPFVFVAHSPPYDTPLDVLYNGMHAGSLGVRRFIEKWSMKGLLMVSLHGHIHESPSRSGSISVKVGKSLCINPGQGSGDNATFRYVIFGLAEEASPPGIKLVQVGR